MAMKHGDAHLEIINTEKDGTIRIEGERIDVIFTWMQLSVQVAFCAGSKSGKGPSPSAFGSMCFS